ARPAKAQTVSPHRACLFLLSSGLAWVPLYATTNSPSGLARAIRGLVRQSCRGIGCLAVSRLVDSPGHVEELIDIAVRNCHAIEVWLPFVPRHHPFHHHRTGDFRFNA